MKLVVGLGNPGKKYEATRHNAGRWWVEQLASAARVELREAARYFGRIGKIAAPHEIWLLLPDTYMNQSGRAVAALAGFHKIEPGEILVVHDELDLPPGTARLKKGGGTGGHNGLNDIAARLGSRDFWRLRLGIGHPRNAAATEQEVADYVLHKPSAAERSAIDDAIAASLEVWPLIAEDGFEAAMLRLHTKTVKRET
ncbi:MAG: aminoacyl-tRNA hydrolase [Burkholderiales bacterium]